MHNDTTLYCEMETNCKIVNVVLIDRQSRSFLTYYNHPDNAYTRFYHRIDKGFLVSMAKLLQFHIQKTERNQLRRSRVARIAQNDEFLADDSIVDEYKEETAVVTSRIEAARDKFEFIKNVWINSGKPFESCEEEMEMPDMWVAEIIEKWDDIPHPQSFSSGVK